MAQMLAAFGHLLDTCDWPRVASQPSAIMAIQSLKYRKSFSISRMRSNDHIYLAIKS